MLLNRLVSPVALIIFTMPLQTMAASTGDTSATGNITVTANIASSCQVTTTNSSTPLSGDFGDISFDTSGWMQHKIIDATPLELIVTCTSGTTPVVELNSPNYADSSWEMVNGKDNTKKIAYKLFSDSSYTSLISENKDINVNKANPFDIVIAAQIPAISDSSTVAPGSYKDVVQMTVNWSGS